MIVKCWLTICRDYIKNDENKQQRMACYVHNEHKGLPMSLVYYLQFFFIRVLFDGLLSASVACPGFLEIVGYSTAFLHCTLKRPSF